MVTNNLYPDIQFEEINDSPRPIQIGSINRIGIVGTFRKGPYNTFRLISSYEQFRLAYGATVHLGSVGVQTAMEQGADDFGLMRVLGAAQKATSSVTFTPSITPAVAASGTVTLGGTVTVGNTVTATINGQATAFTITPTETTLALVAEALRLAVNANTNVNTLVTATRIGAVITVTALTAGAAGNTITLASSVSGGATITAVSSGATLAGGANAINNVTAGNVEITVAQYENDNVTLDHTTTATLAVTNGMTAAQIANAAIALINGTPVMSADVGAVYDSGGTVDLTADTAGLLGNYLKVTLTIPGVGGAGGLVVSPAVATNFTGGADGPKKSALMLQDSTITPADLLAVSAASDGTWGDDLVVTTAPGSAAGYFNMTVKDTTTNDTESYFDLNFATDSLDPDTDELIALKGSNMIRGVYVGGDPSLTPAVVTLLPLSGGSDGPPISDQDYLDALKLLENNVVNYVMAPGQTSAAIRAALISQAENSGSLNGFRVAILNADKAMPIETLSSVTQLLNTASGSAVMVAGWGTYAGQTRLGRFKASPDCVYAGHLAVTASQVSPAARSSSPFIKGITEVDTVVSEQAFNEYTKARMEAIIVDPATGGLHCLNGRTLSSDGSWYWVSVRRVYNQIKSDLFRMVQWVKSQPNTTALRNQLAQQLDTYMEAQLGRGMIGNFKRSLVDSTNNPLGQIASGYLRAEVYFVPVFPADHVIIGIHRYLAADVLTQVGGA